MKKLNIIIFLGLISLGCMGQNLIFNPSFEIYSKRNNDTRDIQYCTGWEYSMTEGIIASTPNLFIANYTNDKFTNKHGLISAHTGDCYAGVLDDEYLIFIFSENLEKDSLYRIKFWYSLSMESDQYTSCFSYRFISDDSLFFHDLNIEQSQREKVFNSLRDSLVNIDCDSCMFYGWHEMNFYYTASGNESAFMLGIYFPSFPGDKKAECVELLSKGRVKLSSSSKDIISPYYFMDDISIEKVNPPLEVGKTVIARDILFETGSSTINPKSYNYLNSLADYLLLFTDLKIQISGHTDNVGSAVNNQKLSEERAEAVKNYLVTKDISPDRINTKGFGATKPVADNINDEGKALNRRIEVEITE